MLLFGPAVVLSAFLLFLVEPLAGKQMLPLFGGSAAVWSACLIFFQLALLGGYLYAHALTRWCTPRRQALIHSLTLIACLAIPHAELTGGGHSPSVLVALTRTVGLAYLLLSATSPLLQHWHSLLHPGGRPYRLSAWSNAACAVALLSFPFFWERHFGLRQLNLWWTLGFAFEALLLILAAGLLYKANPAAMPRPIVSGTTWSERLAWVLWSALGSAFLMASSTHLCQMVAPLPLLWVVPLLVYLFSFVVVFSRESYDRRTGTGLALFGLLLMTACMLYFDLQAELAWKIALYAAGLFAVCLFAHGELGALRPAPERITSYWTHVALGGALGSLCLGFVTPSLLKGYFELPLLVAATGLLCLWRLWPSGRALRQAAAMAALMAATPAMALVNSYYSGLVEAGRNFYGSLRVADQDNLRKMLNGLVVHGSEFLTGENVGKPTAYYGPGSGVGLLLQREGPARRVGLVGLGAGTLAVYGRPGDVFRFYELNPLVIQLARSDFQYLGRSHALIEIVEGDARLTLASEKPQGYDILVLDAFSGDAIPAHLLTREAMAIYRTHLAPGGQLAMHISNQYLNLEPVVRALAADSGWSATRISSPPSPERALLGATWMILQPGKARVQHSPRTWTDDWSSVTSVLK